MLDIAAAEEAFKNDNISNISLIHLRDYIADELTKRIMQTSQKKALFQKLEISMVQWIMKPNAENHGSSIF